MTILAWVLMLLFAFVLCLLVSLLFYHPQKIINKELGNAETADEEEAIDYTELGKKQIDELIVRFPDMKIYMEIKKFEHGVLLHWKGSVSGSRILLFSLTNEDCRNACMEAVQRFYEDEQIMECGLYLILPYAKKLEKDAAYECREYLRNQGIHISGVLLDGSDNEFLLHQARPQALVGTSTGAYAELKVNGNPRKTQAWIESLKPAKLLPYHCSPYLHKIVSSIRRQIPFMIRMELYLMPKKGMKDLLTMMPDAWIWMRASIEKRKDMIVLRAPDQQLLEEAVHLLEEEASRNSFYLVETNQMTESSICRSDDWIYQHVSNAIESTLTVKGILPVPINETGMLGHFDEWKTCRYMPLTQNKKESSEATILFYQMLLKA